MNDRDREVIKKMMKYCSDIEYLMDKYNSDIVAFKTDISFQYASNIK